MLDVSLTHLLKPSQKMRHYAPRTLAASHDPLLLSIKEDEHRHAGCFKRSMYVPFSDPVQPSPTRTRIRSIFLYCSPSLILFFFNCGSDDTNRVYMRLCVLSGCAYIAQERHRRHSALHSLTALDKNYSLSCCERNKDDKIEQGRRGEKRDGKNNAYMEKHVRSHIQAHTSAHRHTSTETHQEKK